MKKLKQNLKKGHYYLLIGSVLLCLVHFQACQSKKTSDRSDEDVTKNNSSGYNGVYKSYRDGYLYSEVMLVNGEKNGLARRYYSNGKVNTEVYYENNVKIGTSKWFYTNGKVYRETPYENGKINGIQKKYHKDGTLMAEIPYESGNRKIGLQEYSFYGSPVTSYPNIVIHVDDQRSMNGLVKVSLSLSNKSKNVKFYEGDIINGIFDDELSTYILTEDGKGIMRFTENLDYEGKKIINIIAIYKTKLVNKKILQKKLILPSNHLKK